MTDDTLEALEAMKTKLPLTGSQRNIWFHQLLNMAEPAYNGGNQLEVDGKLDIDRLNRAQKRLIMNTEVLRLTIHTINDEPYQVVNEFKPPDLNVWDFREEKDAEVKMSKVLQEQQYRLFDLEKGPLYRFGLIRLNENRWIWFWFFHHIIMDGMGLANLLERLVFLYENPEHEDWEHTQFIEFAAEEIAYKKSENWKKDKTFWSDYLSDSAAPVSFSSKQHQPINLSISSITKEFLSVVESQAIKQLCKEYRITTYSFFAAAMVLYIHR